MLILSLPLSGTYHYIKIGSVCLCHCYFLAPCDKHKHTAHTHQQAASQASTDSAWRQPVWLPRSSLGFQRPVGLRLTSQSTIALARLWLVVFNTPFLRPTRFNIQKGISICSAIFAELTVVTDRQTDRPRYSVCSNRPHHQPGAAMRPDNNNTPVYNVPV